MNSSNTREKHSPNTGEKWEKEFDKKFVETDYHNGWTVPHVCISAKQVKSFIKSLLKEERERIKKELSTIPKEKKEGDRDEKKTA